MVNQNASGFGAQQPRPAQSPTPSPNVSMMQGGGAYNPNPNQPYGGANQQPSSAGWPQHMIARGPDQETMASGGVLNYDAQQQAQSPGQLVALQPGMPSTPAQYQQGVPQAYHNQQAPQMPQQPQMLGLPALPSTDDRLRILNQLQDLPRDRGYICHATIRNGALQTSFGMINLDQNGVAILPIETALKVANTWPAEFSCRGGSEASAPIFEKAQAPPGQEPSENLMTDPRTGQNFTVAKGRKAQAKDDQTQQQQAQPPAPARAAPVLAAPEQLSQQSGLIEELRARIAGLDRELAREKAGGARIDTNALQQYYGNPMIVDLAHNLVGQHMEVISLIGVVSDCIIKERGDLAIGILWTAFKEAVEAATDFDGVPQEFVDIMVEAKISFDEPGNEKLSEASEELLGVESEEIPLEKPEKAPKASRKSQKLKGNGKKRTAKAKK